MTPSAAVMGSYNIYFVHVAVFYGSSRVFSQVVRVSGAVSHHAVSHVVARCRVQFPASSIVAWQLSR